MVGFTDLELLVVPAALSAALQGNLACSVQPEMPVSVRPIHALQPDIASLTLNAEGRCTIVRVAVRHFRNPCRILVEIVEGD